MTLVALFTMTAGAWAQDVKLNVTELTEDMVTGWSEDETLITSADLINFMDVTLEQAKAWTGAPSSGVAILAYGFNGTAIKLATFNNGSFVNYTPIVLKRKQAYSYLSQYKIYYTSFVAINEAKTEATFTMPTSDVDVSYELVRDMQDETNPVAFSGLPSSGNIVVKKGGDGKYQPAEALTIQLIDPLAAAEAQNIIAADGITIKVLVGAENEKGTIDYDQENPITLEAFLADMKPGYYWIKAESTDENSPYDGTVYSQELLLSNGYEITVGAGEYATFYKDEIIYTEDEDAELYTISSVSDAEAVLSDKLAMVAANTPMLVYNKGTEAKTFILLPSLKEDADEVTVAREFRGTLAEKEMPASSTTVDYYVCTGKAFEWVRDAGVIAANKCWLQIGNQPAAARAMTRSITGGGDTTNMDDVRWQMEDGNYYDLQGRKVAKPTRGGIYIHNGRKVVKK